MGFCKFVCLFGLGLAFSLRANLSYFFLAAGLAEMRAQLSEQSEMLKKEQENSDILRCKSIVV